MKKGKIIPVLIIAVVLISPILLLIHNGVIVLDHSAKRTGEQGHEFIWKDVRYVACNVDYHEGKTIAKTEDGFSINEVKEDKTHTFLVLRSYIDQWVCVREDYVIPESGKLNAVFIDGTQFMVERLTQAIDHILANFTPEYKYETDNYWSISEDRILKEITFCFDDCPVGYSRDLTLLGSIDGKWVFAKLSDWREDTSAEAPIGVIYTFDVYTVPNECIDVIEEHWKQYFGY